MNKLNFKLLGIFVLGAAMGGVAGYLDGRRAGRDECASFVDNSLSLVSELNDRLHAIPACDCPGPEECDMEATCNRDAMLCCMTLARQQETEEP